MATSQQFLVCDSSTVANFKQWGQAISLTFSTFGWLQSSDTGQVNWSTIAAVPGSGAFVYEIWEPNDGLTNFFVKLEYGNVSGTNCPSLRVSIGTGTNGAGTLTGFFTSVLNTNATTFTPPSTTTQYECDFSGAAGRYGALMWRNGTNNSPQFFCIERSVNSSGAYTSSYVTVVAGGVSNLSCFSQQTLLFGVGATPTTNARSSGNNTGGYTLNVSLPFWNSGTTSFNGSIPFDNVRPNIGYNDYPMTTVGCGAGLDFVEGVTFTVTLYGSTRTYMPTKNGSLGFCLMWNGFVNGPVGALCMRYD
jgi:hypothetical protein